MSDFSDAYFRANKDIAGVGGALESAAFVNDVQSAIDAALAAMKIESDRLVNVGVNYVKGNLAEVWHAETLKVAAVAKGNEEVWAEALINCKTGLNSTHKCNAHPCINFVRRLPAQAFSRA